MFRRVLAVQALIVAVSCMGVFASSAAAMSPQLLPLKSCKLVMAGGDFNDGLSELEVSDTSSSPGDDGEFSVCAFASTEADGPGVLREFPTYVPPAMPTLGEPIPPQLSFECLANGLKPTAREPPEPPQAEPLGCFSVVSVRVGIFVGSKVEAEVRHAGPNPRNYRDKGAWPVGVSRSVLHTFGPYADAELGYGTASGGEPVPQPYDIAYGYLHIKNAQITIEEKDAPPRAPTSMLTLLEDAKHTL